MQAMTAQDIQAAYAAALRLLQAGKQEQALQAFGRILEANPRIAEAHYQAARIFFAHGRLDRALTHFAAAAGLKPKEAAIWTQWAGAVAVEGQAATEAAFLAALKTAPIAAQTRIALQDRFGAQRAASRPASDGVPPADLKKLLALMGARNFPAAEALAATMLKRFPAAAVVANILASARAAQGRTAAALAGFQEAVRIDPSYAEAYDNMGRTLLTLGREAEAGLAFREAVARAPSMVSALVHLGIHYSKQDEPAKALPYLDRALAADPRSVSALVALGNAHSRLQQHEQAETLLLRALQLSKGQATEALVALAQVQAHLGKDAEAVQTYDAVLARIPDHPVALGGKAALLQTLGRFDEAEQTFRHTFEVVPNNGENYRLFLASHKASAGDPIIRQMQERFDDPGVPEMDRMSFGFAIAKALEDIKDNDRVFHYLNLANGLMRKAFPFDIAQRRKELEMVQAAMSGFDWQGTLVEGATDYAPIFVTGMPRSGTTLVEQIIASHSQVASAGEVGDGTRFAQKLLSEGLTEGLRPMSDLSHAEIAGLGRDYETLLRGRFPDVPHVTDKSIQTYLFLGLMKLALPAARFIVVRRDPRDTLLSIYKNRFPNRTHLYAYDQRDLAHYYTTFVQMVDFWREQLPGGFYEVQYEALVADPETESRRLIAACGLDWQDQCLNFHANRNKVETLSVFQVRQPITAASVKGWKRYERELAPMLEVLAADGHIPDPALPGS